MTNEHLCNREKFSINLNELAWKLSLNVLMWNAKVKTMPIVKWKFQIGQLEIFTILVCKVMYSCQFNILNNF